MWRNERFSDYLIMCIERLYLSSNQFFFYIARFEMYTLLRSELKLITFQLCSYDYTKYIIIFVFYTLYTFFIRVTNGVCKSLNGFKTAIIFSINKVHTKPFTRKHKSHKIGRYHIMTVGTIVDTYLWHFSTEKL